MSRSASSQPVFQTLPVTAELQFDFHAERCPSTVAGWNRSSLSLDDCGPHFGYVHSEEATLSSENGTFTLKAGMYFSVPGPMEIQGDGSGFVVSSIGYRGLFQIGGPIEETGRLRYIDGCTDSLLTSPVIKGDPCLNLLHIPPHTDQTTHTHPSLRIGLIVDGEGFCRTPDGPVPMTPGLMFVIQTDGEHSFHTESNPLRIVVWHPDSDFGPTHETHPMINRTLVEGSPINMIGPPE